MNEHAKVRFIYENSDGGTEVESMWTIEREDGYEIDNIPFFAKSLAVGDLVAARRDKDGLLWFARMIRLGRMGCESELSDIPELVAVDIPPTVKYEEVKSLLDEGEREGCFEYQEACIGFV